MTNRELVATFFEEFFNKHDFSAIDKYMSPDYIQHDLGCASRERGIPQLFWTCVPDVPQFPCRCKAYHC